MVNVLLSGPAGAGKSQRARAMMESGEFDVLVDFTAIHTALAAAERGPDGKYPVRRAGDPLLALAEYLRVTAIRQAVDRGLRVLATNSDGSGDRRAHLLRLLRGDRDEVRQAQAEAVETVVDPGFLIVASRLIDPAVLDQAGDLAALTEPEIGDLLSGECSSAVGRWYGRL